MTALTGFLLLENGLPAKNVEINFSQPMLGRGPEVLGKPVKTDENGNSQQTTSTQTPLSFVI